MPTINGVHIKKAYTKNPILAPFLSKALIIARTELNRFPMTRVKCKKCGAIFETGAGALLAPHVGPLHYIKCPACGRRSWMNVYSSVKEAVTWPRQEAQQATVEPTVLSEEELERKRIEDSKYEKP
jgi:DNA-directed RNA polymerase subunit RPC12/RpoP